MGNPEFQATGCWARQVYASLGKSKRTILDFRRLATERGKFRQGKSKRVILDFELRLLI